MRRSTPSLFDWRFHNILRLEVPQYIEIEDQIKHEKCIEKTGNIFIAMIAPIHFYFAPFSKTYLFAEPCSSIILCRKKSTSNASSVTVSEKLPVTTATIELEFRYCNPFFTLRVFGFLLLCLTNLYLRILRVSSQFIFLKKVYYAQSICEDILPMLPAALVNYF